MEASLIWYDHLVCACSDTDYLPSPTKLSSSRGTATRWGLPSGTEGPASAAGQNESAAGQPSEAHQQAEAQADGQHHDKDNRA